MSNNKTDYKILGKNRPAKETVVQVATQNTHGKLVGLPMFGKISDTSVGKYLGRKRCDVTGKMGFLFQHLQTGEKISIMLNGSTTIYFKQIPGIKQTLIPRNAKPPKYINTGRICVPIR